MGFFHFSVPYHSNGKNILGQCHMMCTQTIDHMTCIWFPNRDEIFWIVKRIQQNELRFQAYFFEIVTTLWNQYNDTFKIIRRPLFPVIWENTFQKRVSGMVYMEKIHLSVNLAKKSLVKWWENWIWILL